MASGPRSTRLSARHFGAAIGSCLKPRRCVVFLLWLLCGIIVYRTLFYGSVLRLAVSFISSILSRLASYEQVGYTLRYLEEELTYCNVFFGGDDSNPTCGKMFSSTWIPHLQRLGLTNEQIARMTEEDDERILKKDPVFVTAVEDSHYKYFNANLFAQAHPSRKILVYDMGLTHSQLEDLHQKSYIMEVRRFNFDAYPEYVRDLMEYRWKPLIIAETLKEFEAVLYADAHIMWRKDGYVADLLEKMRCQLQGCDYYSAFLLGGSFTSIFSVTHKGIYKYLPTPLTQSKQIEMGMGGFQLTHYTKDVRSNIHKWWALCALEKECMAPTGSQLKCDFSHGAWSASANCNRYDQSAVNILLANRNRYNRERYIVDFTHGTD